MVRTITVYNDFGTEGISLSSVIPNYQETPERTLEFNKRINNGIKKSWGDSLDFFLQIESLTCNLQFYVV